MFSRRSEVVEEAVPRIGFADNGAHLRAEIDWLHQLVRSEIRLADRRAGERGFDEFAGLYISRDEIDRYLAEPSRPDEPLDGAQAGQCSIEVTTARAALDRRIQMSLAAGIDLRLARLAGTFELDDVARTALLCCAAAELDARFTRLFAYLQDDAGKKRPTFWLLARLATGRAVDPIGLRGLFGPSSSLFCHRLLDPQPDTIEGPFPTTETRLAAGLIDFLVGTDRLPPLLAESTELIAASAALDRLAYHRHHQAIIHELLRCRQATGRLPLCYVAGPEGAGKRLIARTLAAAIDKDLLHVRAAKLPTAVAAIEDFGRLLRRESRLRDCVVLLDGIDEGLGESDREQARAGLVDCLLQALVGCDVMASGIKPPAELRHRLRARPLGFELAYPTVDERTEVWRRRLPAHVAAELTADIPVLASKFRFTPGQIAEAIDIATMTAPCDANGHACITNTGLYARCRNVAEQGLHLFCQKIVPRYEWNDIVLPADTQAQLREICRWLKHRSQVYDAWGFGTKLGLGKGLTVLFSGASGTGKTMSAEIIAGELQLDLFRVDLSRVVSKYIGETEKNLSRIFAQIYCSNCVLFFDEADALFGKRTEVKDAHDRYANIEINYLLMEMDRYEGVIIVSTNMKGNFDQAFTRRFSHIVEYPIPGERLREAIWRKSFPQATPLAADVDFAFLAEKFNLPGGSIKNIALNSAFLAAAEGGEVTMGHVILATKREYQKIGRVCSKSDFGQHYALVREAEPQ
jgi:AAA+ superfamily predicted ATPase